MTANNDAPRFTRDHEWLLAASGDVVIVGITDYAQRQLGDLVFVQQPDVGSRFDVGDEVVVVESVKAAGEIKAPLAGTVVEVNTALADDPATVNADPMGAGWLFKLKLDRRADLDGLLDPAAYEHYLETEC